MVWSTVCLYYWRHWWFVVYIIGVRVCSVRSGLLCFAVLVPRHACKGYSIQSAVAAAPLHSRNRLHDRLEPLCRCRHLLLPSRLACSHWSLISSCSSSSATWTKFLCLSVSPLLHVALPPPLATGDAELSSTSESYHLTYHFVVPVQMWLAQTC